MCIRDSAEPLDIIAADYRVAIGAGGIEPAEEVVIPAIAVVDCAFIHVVYVQSVWAMMKQKSDAFFVHTAIEGHVKLRGLKYALFALRSILRWSLWQSILAGTF